MDGRSTAQMVSSRSLRLLLRHVYEGRLLLPRTGLPTWNDERRLRAFEAIYRGLPLGCLAVLRTSVELEYQRDIGGVSLLEPREDVRGPREYVVDGLGLVRTLFEELGPAFHQGDVSGGPGSEQVAQPRSSLVFDVQTRAFRARRAEQPLGETEFALSDLFDAERPHDFSARVSRLPEGPRLANRLAYLVDAFFDYSVPVLTVVSDDVEGVLDALRILEEAESPSPVRRSRTRWWLCDTCGQRIAHPKDGWVEWLVRFEGPQSVGKGLRLVHHRPASPLIGGCQYHERQEFALDRSTVHDLPLESFLGDNGLTRLLALLAEARLPQAEVIEMIKRLHTPGYERARLHAEGAMSEGVFSPNMPEGLFSQRQIEAILEWADEEGREP
jgi:hypothetical protein